MQTRRSSTFALRLVAMLALLGALALLGCPSDDEDDAVIIGTQTVPLSAARAAALVGDTFAFGRVPAFNTNVRTDVVFDDPNAVTISTAADTTTAGAEYGSCIFTPGDDSTFPPGSPLGGTDPIEIVLCNLIINGGEFTVGGVPGPCTIRLALGTVLSVPVDATCALGADGSLIVNETLITGSVGVGG